MIKELSSDSISVFTKNIGKKLWIEEKFDTTYFSVTISSFGTESIRNMNGAHIDFVDYTINSVYRDIIEFCGNLSDSIKDSIEDTYEMGFHYFPNTKPKTIEYPEYEDKFFLHKIWKHNGYERTEIPFEDAKSLLSHVNMSNIIYKEKTTLTISTSTIDKTNRYLSGDMSELMYIHELMREVPKENRPKASQMTKAEAYILRVDNNTIKVTVNEKKSLPYQTQKKMARDMVLKDFTNWYTETKPIIPIGHTYIGTVSNLFLQYINNTDIFNKYSLSKEDMTPPSFGSIGDMSYDFIENETVVTIIKNDENRMALFRVLLAALRKPLQKKKGDILTNRITDEFNKIVGTIKAME